MSLFSLPPHPHKPTNQSSREQRQGTCLGSNHVGTIAAPFLGVEGQAELAMTRIVIVVFVGLAANIVFSRKQPKIDQNQKSEILSPC
jgi:hypothetical protein